ncbi:MAG: hypothetical protein ACQESP_08760 [Candidatus Muiribacteriota bacterium]
MSKINNLIKKIVKEHRGLKISFKRHSNLDGEKFIIINLKSNSLVLDKKIKIIKKEIYNFMYENDLFHYLVNSFYYRDILNSNAEKDISLDFTHQIKLKPLIYGEIKPSEKNYGENQYFDLKDAA